jgi:hypothetical protein
MDEGYRDYYQKVTNSKGMSQSQGAVPTYKVNNEGPRSGSLGTGIVSSYQLASDVPSQPAGALSRGYDAAMSYVSKLASGVRSWTSQLFGAQKPSYTIPSNIQGQNRSDLIETIGYDPYH